MLGIELLISVCTVGFSLLAEWIALKRTPDYKKGSKFNAVCLMITAAVVLTMYFFFGSWNEKLKGIITAVIFIYASVCDYRERKVADCVSLMLLLTGCIGIESKTLVFRFVSAAGMFFFLVLLASMKNSKFGGADVKFITAGVFLIGLMNGLSAVIISLLLAVVCTLIRNKVKNTNEQSIPLIPYLSIGFLTVILTGGF